MSAEERTSARPSLTAALASTATKEGPRVQAVPEAPAPLGEDVDLEEYSLGGPRVPFATLTKTPPIGDFGPYQLLGRIAFGGMAEIFLAREGAENGVGGRFVIVKRVLPHVAANAQFITMFKDEARLAMQLSHPNICHVYAFGHEADAYFLAMEWVNGMTLSKILRRARSAGGLSVPITMKIIALVAEALDYAHRAADQTTGEPLGIVHRDVSPQNVMVSYDGIVKLLDFGIAKASSHSTHTEAGVVKGKFAYMAPEQCLGEPIDARADVFALGVCLYELLDGKNPFKRQTEFDTMRALVYEEPPSLLEAHPHISPRLDEIVRRAIAKRREDRYQAALDLQMALEQELVRIGELVPTSRISDRMSELFANEIKAGPRLDTRIDVPKRAQSESSDQSLEPIPLPRNATERIAVVSSDEAARTLEPTEEGKKRRPIALLAAILLALMLLGGGLLFAAFFTGAIPIEGLGAPTGQPTLAAEAPPGPTIGPPPSEPPPAPTTGTLLIESTPSSASVTLGDRGVVGTTPLELGRLDAQTWTVRLTLDGYEPWEGVAAVSAGERIALHRALVATSATEVQPSGRERGERQGSRSRGGRATAEEAEAPAAAPGLLSLNTQPWSRVYVGSRLLGTTPLGNVEVPSGRVSLRLVDRDGGEHRRTITVPSGGHAREFFDLRSDPAE